VEKVENAGREIETFRESVEKYTWAFNITQPLQLEGPGPQDIREAQIKERGRVPLQFTRDFPDERLTTSTCTEERLGNIGRKQKNAFETQQGGRWRSRVGSQTP